MKAEVEDGKDKASKTKANQEKLGKLKYSLDYDFEINNVNTKLFFKIFYKRLK